MNLSVALGLWLTNAVLAALLGFWLGRTMSRSEAPALPAGAGEPGELLDDLEADASRADEDLAEAIGELEGAEVAAEVESAIGEAEARVRGKLERLLRCSRIFERRLARGHGKMSRIASAGDAWLALADEVLRHRSRVGDFCRFLEEEIAAPLLGERGELLKAIRTLLDRNQRLRRELDAVKSRLAQQEVSLTAAERDARVDPLTRLPNRRAFDERLAACQARAERGVESYALVLFDLDRFKELNDARGHQFGDAVLAVFGRILGEAVRATDHAARYGGEEFAVLLPGADAAAAAAVAERCRRQAEKATVRRADVQETFTVSGGIAAWAAGRSAEDLLTAADQALYMAKAEGRNCVRVAGVEAAGSHGVAPGAAVLT